MTTFNHILVLLDPNDTEPNSALLNAVAYASQHDATLSVATVMPELPHSFDVARWQLSSESIRQNITQAVQQRIQHVLCHVGLSAAIKTHVLFGTLYLEVIQLVIAEGFDCVIKQAQSPQWLDHLFDSDDMHLLRKCPSPVWLLKPESPQTFKRIAVAVDVNEEEETHKLNESLVIMAAQMACQHGAQLDLIHVYSSSLANFASMWADDPDKMEQDMLEECRLTAKQELTGLLDSIKSTNQTFADSKCKVNYHLVNGIPEKHIAATLLSLKSDLLVMGTVARTGVKGLIIGNTAEAILMQLKCSVIAIKPEGFTSPLA